MLAQFSSVRFLVSVVSELCLNVIGEHSTRARVSANCHFRQAVRRALVEQGRAIRKPPFCFALLRWMRQVRLRSLSLDCLHSGSAQ
jgi:hypothetical protein